LLPDDNPDKILNFTGVSDPYENPANADLILYTDSETPEESTQRLVDFILEHIDPRTK